MTWSFTERLKPGGAGLGSSVASLMHRSQKEGIMSKYQWSACAAAILVLIRSAPSSCAAVATDTDCLRRAKSMGKKIEMMD